MTNFGNVSEKDLNDLLVKINYGADINLRNENNDTALMLAVGYGRLDLVNRLMDAGADPKVKDSSGRDVLLHLCFSGYGNSSLVLSLVDKMIVDLGCDINTTDNDGNNILHYTLEEEKLNYVSKYLSKRGIDLNHKNNQKQIPLIIACENSNYKIVPFVIGEETVFDLDVYGKSSLYYAVEYPDVRIVKELLMYNPTSDFIYNQGLLKMADKYSDKEIYKLLYSYVSSNVKSIEDMGW